MVYQFKRFSRVAPNIVLLITIISVTAISSAHAASFGMQVGTLGVGLETTQSLHNNLKTRFGFNTFSRNLEGEEQGVNYEAEVKLQSFNAILDWHPFAGSFRLSAGMMLNQNSVTLTNKSNSNSYDIGEETYITNDLAIKGEIGFQPLAPYIGFGWGLAPSKRRAWGFSAEFGVVYMGQVDVDLSASGTATKEGDPNSLVFNVGRDADFQESLAQEEYALEQDIKDYKLLPVVAVGFIYSF